MYYLIKDKLEEIDKNELVDNGFPYVITYTSKQWEKEKNNYPISDHLEEESDIYFTKADVNYHYLSGSFSIPNHDDLNLDDYAFSFILNEDGMVFIDDTEYVNKAISYILKTKKWHEPSLERFIYDLLDYIVKDDLRIMEKYELELEKMEDDAESQSEDDLPRLNQIRSELRRYYTHYEELIDLTQELYENENNFFKADNLNYFRSYLNRLERLSNTTSYLRDYVIQINDTYKEQIAIKQNNITTLLTVITTIFAPLTLITGWYGMNFRYMPELNERIAYPMVFAVSVAIAITLLYYFKKKKWM